MKTCPYCKSPIEEFWSYCRNCNKPLITNLEDTLERNGRFTYNEHEIYHLDLEDGSDLYDDIVI